MPRKECWEILILVDKSKRSKSSDQEKKKKETSVLREINKFRINK